MRSLILVVAISALAWARPETYKETEEFQYARSSSDEGSKSGYYGAQRGNVAGNYEKAHNMDTLAQHQMSGAINQVQGELGDASKTRAGSVYTAANTAGHYGSGYHDLSNLQGRHFGDSSSSDSIHSSSLAASNQHSNADWRSQSQQSAYGASSQLGQSSLHSGSLHAADSAGYGSSLGSNSHSTGYHSASGYQSRSGYNSQNVYDQSSLTGQSGAYGTGDQTRRYTVVTPVRIIARPGTQIAIPVYGEAGYDAYRASSSVGQSSSNRYASQTAASSFDQNAINSEAEVLNNNQQHIGSVPTPNGKHYSSSYDYHKAWERHSETTDAPVTVAPVVNPLSVNSELYEDAQGASANSYDSANRYNSYSGSSQSSHQADYRSQHNAQASSQSDVNSNAYTQGAHGSHSGLAPLVDAQPKSYQSSYAYHKSWEKQGDPYVIYPSGTTGEASQRIVSGTKNAASSQRYGSHQHYSQGSAVDCDSLCRYRRSTRSADYYQQDLGQQAQTAWDQSLSQQAQNSFQQHNQSAKLEDLGQQTQNLEDFGQQSQSAHLEDLGQQTQNLEDFSQQSQSAHLEDLGQQTQNLEDLGQQTQQSWGNIQQQSQSQNLEDFGQQKTQGKWHELNHKFESNLEDLGQQSRQSWSNIEQQASHTQGQWHDMATNSHQSEQTLGNLDNFGQQTQSKWDNIEGLSQQTQKTEDLGQKTHNNWDDLDQARQQVQTQWNNINTINKTRHTDTNTEQQTQTHFGSVDEVKPNREHAGNTLNTFNKENSGANNPADLEFWGLTNNQKHENNHNYSQHSYNNHNSYSNSQDHGVSWGQHVNNNNAQTSHNNPLQSIWDKIDNMEEQSEHSNENQQHTEYQNSQHSYGQENISQHDSNWASSNWNQQQAQSSGYQPSIIFNSTSDKPKNDQLPKEVAPEKPKDDDDDETPEELEPAEVGRGDIGAEGDSKTTPKSVQNYQTYTTQLKPEKSPEDIEALSLSRGTDQYTTESDTLSVLSISQQKSLEEQRQRATEELHQIRRSKSSTTTPRSVKHTTSHGQTGAQHFLGQPEEIQEHDTSENIQKNYHNLQQQNTMQQNQDFHQQNQQQSQNIDQHNQNVDTQNFDQQNTDQQFEDFGQQTQDLNQQNLQEFTNLGQQSQNLDQLNTEEFGQQSRDLSQQNLQQFHHLGQHTQKHDQQNTEQQFEDFGQQTQDLNQQNLQEFPNLGQHSQNFDQLTTGDFGQQNQDLSQHNLQQFHHLGQHTQKLDQQNTEQQFEDFGQQTQDLTQQNLQQFSNLEQHSQTSYQHEAREFVTHSHTQVAEEQKITPVSDHGSQTNPKQDIEIVPPSVTTTEKPGFWKSVGGKLTSAKDSVASWFRRS
ncbi:GATA zinc finger domain-containing protein 14-like isoform X2 [Cydia splendana]|uniref:GATA zinc finger domain-containing protein 14-like isoform X2 n=1 Tax=Cydia splendana TaxID=1100963 RepID=UPI00300C8F09